MKSWVVHYKNKYPDSRVVASENSVDVFRGDEHLVSLQKGGDGGWHDQSEAMGLSERHDLAPIPRDARVHKVVSGKIGLDEEAEARKSKRAEFVRGGKVASQAELQKEGYAFDDKGRVVARPEKPSKNRTAPA